jgi:hypothetical protein
MKTTFHRKRHAHSMCFAASIIVLFRINVSLLLCVVGLISTRRIFDSLWCVSVPHEEKQIIPNYFVFPEVG